MKNIMIDLETLGTRPGCAILSIGAVPFDLYTGQTGDPFFITISEGSNLLCGLFPEPKTVAWWKNQSAEVQALNFSGKHSLPQALKQFTAYLNKTFATTPVFAWGNNVSFDLGILRFAYDACQLPYPFDPFRERDFRTLMSLLPHLRYTIQRQGLRHDPVQDALFEVACAVEVFGRIHQALGQTLDSAN